MKKLFLTIFFIFIFTSCSTNSRNIKQNQSDAITIKPYFSQTNSNFNDGGGVDDLLVKEIKNAKKSLYLAIYGFTNDRLRDALIEAYKNGIDIIIVTDDTKMASEDMSVIKNSGIKVISDESPNSLMHHKFLVIDESVVWTGSANYSYYAFYKNNENLVKLTSSKIAKVYLDEFDELLKGVDKEGAYVSEKLEIYFSPEDDFEQRLLQLLDDASQSIDFLAFAFTNDNIALALIEKHKQGLEVRGVFDKKQNDGFLKKYSKYSKLLSNSLDVKLDGNRQTMHNKVFIIDKKTVITGSYNFTIKANEDNNENSIVVHNKEFASRYTQEFEEIFSLGL